MDVFLPTDMEILVAVGQRVVGGESILARDRARAHTSVPAELDHA
jgi:hypothetical protein